jgi:hypothetical protein
MGGAPGAAVRYGSCLMTDDRKALALTVLLAGLFTGLVFLAQPYTAPGGPLTKPAQRYVRAALRGDSLRLAALSASTEPVAWALAAGRSHRESLAYWSGYTQTSAGVPSGDTMEVFLYPSGDQCSQSPIVLHFVGSGRDAKVVSASSACIAVAGP